MDTKKLNRTRVMQEPCGRPAGLLVVSTIVQPGPRLRPNVEGVFAGVYLFLQEKEPRRNSGKTRP